MLFSIPNDVLYNESLSEFSELLELRELSDNECQWYFLGNLPNFYHSSRRTKSFSKENLCIEIHLGQKAYVLVNERKNSVCSLTKVVKERQGQAEILPKTGKISRPIFGQVTTNNMAEKVGCWFWPSYHGQVITEIMTKC